jgi:lysozyme
MKMSQNGTQLLAEWEGFETEVYDDAAGLPTIGVGHLLTQNEREGGKITIKGQAVDYKQGLSEQEVLDLLAQDLERFEAAVNSAVQVGLNQNQFDALVSFAFNVGTQAFQSSTLLKKLNQGLYDEVPAQLRRWNKAGGKVIQGLINRREKEIVLWQS